MSEQLQLRRGTAAQVAAFTGAQGEAIVDTTNNRLVVQDGATAGGFPAAKLSEVVTNARTQVNDAAYSVQTTDRMVAFIALTAARVVSLPAASSFPTGMRLIVIDKSGACSATNTITVTRAGTDLINGVATAAISTAYGFVAIESNGYNKWTIVDSASAAGRRFDHQYALRRTFDRCHRRRSHLGQRHDVDHRRRRRLDQPIPQRRDGCLATRDKFQPGSHNHQYQHRYVVIRCDGHDEPDGPSRGSHRRFGC